MNKQEMINRLVNAFLIDSQGYEIDDLRNLLINGFKGYSKMSGAALLEEIKKKGLDK
jgi:hypothetical protein